MARQPLAMLPSKPQSVPSTGRYLVRMAEGPADIAAAQAIRTRSFGMQKPDIDAFDTVCLHMLVHDADSLQIVGCFRLLLLDSGSDLNRSYAARSYDLSGLQTFSGKIAELGRFCVDPAWCDPDILRVAWGALTEFVDDNGVDLLIGCSSFSGVDPGRYLDAFALLKARHLGPDRWLPGVKAPEVFRFAARLRRKPDAAKALACLPPLLRSYLTMGSWVSDHAVIDRQMNTLHVLTGLEVDAIPPARKRLLRALAHRAGTVGR